MSGSLNVGTLTGQIELEDQFSSVLDLVTRKVESFVDDFDGLMGKAAIGAGALAAGALAATAAITALGNRGADVNDVASSLNHFAGSGENATAIMDKLRAGTMGTVDDFELMRTSSRLLSAGVKLTATDFGTLGQAAFVLQNRGLGGTKEMMDLVSDALVTGRTRALAMKLGVIDVKDAEADFAKTLGITKEELSDAGKAEAHRIAILGMLNAAVKDAGAQERDFGEQIDFAITKARNFVDELASAVASSPILGKALRDIGAAFSETFSGSKEDAIKIIVGWVESFARGVSTAAPYVSGFFGFIKDGIGFISDHSDVLISFGAGLGTVQLATIGAAGVQGALTLGVVGVTGAIDGAIASAGAFVVATGPWIVAIAAVTAAVYIGTTAWKNHQQAVENNNQAARNAARESQNLIDINKRFGTSFTDYGEAVRFANAHIQEMAQGQRELNATTDAALKGLDLEYHATAANSAAMINAEAVAKKNAEAHKALNEALKEQRGALIPLTEQQKLQIIQLENLKLSTSQIATILHVTDSAVALFADDWKRVNEEMKKADSGVQVLAAKDLDSILNPALKRAAAAADDMWHKLNIGFHQGITEQALKDVNLSSLLDIPAQAEKAGYNFSHPFVDSLHDTLSAAPAMIAQGLTGGGGLKGAVKAVGSTFGSTLLSSIFGASGDAKGKILSNMTGMFGDIASKAIPVIGSLIGPLVAGIGKLFGKSEESSKVSPLRNEFFQMAGGLESLNPKVLALTGNLKLVDAVLKAKTVDQYNAAMADLDKLQQQVNADMKTASGLFTDISGKMSGLTSLTPEVGRAIQLALEAKTPADFAVALSQVNGVLDEQTSKQAALQRLAEKYGFTLSEMGPAFAQGQLDQLSKSVIDDWTLLGTLGDRSDDKLKKMSKSFQELVTDALQTGSTLPNSLREPIDRLSKMGLLTDEAGNKFSDLSKLHFSDTLESNLKDVTGALNDLKDVLLDLPSKFALVASSANTELSKIPRQINVDLSTKRTFADVNDTAPVFAAEGGLVTSQGIARILPFTPRGTDTVAAMLSPGEQVIAANNSYGGGGGVQTVIVQVEGREIARASVPFIPDELKRIGRAS